MVIAPVVDPGALRRPETPRVYPLIAAMVSGFLLLATAAASAAAMGSLPNLPQMILGGIGAFLAVFGNYLGKIPKNYILGIRTPWTLASDYVWERTHRAGAPIFVAGGLALFLYSLLQGDSLDSGVVAAIVIATVAIPCLHSYVVWKKTRTLTTD
jgi:uncharacterized membrane protein